MILKIIVYIKSHNRTGSCLYRMFKSRLNLIVRVNDISVMKGVLIKGRKKTDFEFKLSFSSLNKQYTFFIYKTAKCVILPFILPRKTCLCLGESLRWSVS